MNFKVVLALSASLTAFNAWADCLGEICVGEKVINGNNEISSVIAIDNSAGEVVTKDSYARLKSYPASELADEVPSRTLPQGKLVLDEYGNMGIVQIVFRNGKVVYRRNGYSSDSISSSLIPEVEQVKNLKAGIRIIDEYNNKGVVNRLFSNETIHYRRDGYSSDSSTKADQLVIRVDSLGALRKDTEVIDEYNHKAKITDLYQDGRTFYRRAGYSSDTMTNANKLVLKVENLGELARNVEIIDEYNHQGSITDLYQDGRIFYRRAGYSSDNMVSSPKTLVLKVSEVSGLKQGTSVIDEYNHTGHVTLTYKDGRVFYRRKGYSSDNMTRAGQLVKEVTSLGDIKPGTRAVDEYNHEGSVTNCFADGRLIFKRDNYGSSNVTSTIHPEVNEHKVYSKDIRYASNNLRIGKPTAFYSNGMISHEGNVVSELFESVENIEDINKDTELVTILGKTYKAKELYANGVALLNDKDSSIKKIIGYKNLEKEKKERVLQAFTDILINYVQTEKPSDKMINLISTSEDASLAKEDLITFVKRSESWMLNKELRKKIVDLLINTVLPGDSDIQDPEEYSLSVTPADIIDEVKAILDQEQKKYIFVSPDAAKAARKSIIIDISKKLFSARCSVVIKERGVEIKNISKKIDKGDTEACTDELRN